MLKTNTVGRKLYFSVLAVFLVFAVSFIVFQQTREKQYKISTLTLKLANYNELLVEDLALSSSNGILLSDTVNLVDSVRVAEAKLEDFVQEHESKDLRVTLIKPDGKVIYDNMGKDFRKFSNHAKERRLRRHFRMEWEPVWNASLLPSSTIISMWHPIFLKVSWLCVRRCHITMIWQSRFS